MTIRNKKLIVYTLGVVFLLFQAVLWAKYKQNNNPNYDIFNFLYWLFLTAGIVIDPLNEDRPKLTKRNSLQLVLLLAAFYFLGYITHRSWN